MKKSILKKLVYRHVKRIDKWHRMVAGLESELKQVKDETLYITIKVNSKWKKDPVTTAYQIAGDWKTHNPELAHAKKFLVKIIPIGGATGFSLPIKQGDFQGTLDTAQLVLDSLRNRDEKLEDSSTNSIEIFGVFENSANGEIDVK